MLLQKSTMDTLISGVLVNYIPTIIVIGVIVGIFVLAIAGIMRNSGRIDDIARSNLMIQTVVVGIVMLFLSGTFVFAFHGVYMSRFYNQVQESISEKLPKEESINDTNLLSNDVKDTKISMQDPKCVLIVVDTIDCVKKTINDVIGVIISKFVRGMGVVVTQILEKFHFDFLFKLPTQIFDGDPQQVINFDNLLKLTEVVGLAWVYLLIVTHYFKSILFSLDNDYTHDFIGDFGKMLLGFAGVFLARYMAEAVLKTAQAFASFLFSTPLANGLTIALKSLLTDELWTSFGGFTIAFVALAIFVLVYIVLFAFLIFKNAKRYFILLVMVLLAPIFTPMLFFDMTRTMGMIFWNKLIVTSFGLIFDLLILLLVFVFLSGNGLSLGNLILMLIGMSVVVDSNNLIQQIALASEVSGFRSVVRNGFRSGTATVLNLRNYIRSL